MALTGCCGQSQFRLPVIWCKGETNQQLSRFLFLWPSSWHPPCYSNGVKAFSKQCCPCDTKKVSAHMLNLLLLGILPHRESVKLSLQPHFYSHCFLGEHSSRFYSWVKISFGRQKYMKWIINYTKFDTNAHQQASPLSWIRCLTRGARKTLYRSYPGARYTVPGAYCR